MNEVNDSAWFLRLGRICEANRAATYEEVNAMSKYTTGEVAKRCGISVRTVQYYDTRGLLVPSELSEGGRRLYTEGDVQRMRVICFLRDMGLSINSIGALLSDDEPGRVISLLLDAHEQELKKEIAGRQRQMEMLSEIRTDLRRREAFSLESIGDIACITAGKSVRRRLLVMLLLIGIPISLCQWILIFYGLVTGCRWPLAAWLLLSIPCVWWMSDYYYKRVAYICPHCHGVFKPSRSQFFRSRHTPATRHLTCTSCGHKGYCVEIGHIKGGTAMHEVHS